MTRVVISLLPVFAHESDDVESALHLLVHALDSGVFSGVGETAMDAITEVAAQAAARTTRRSDCDDKSVMMVSAFVARITEIGRAGFSHDQLAVAPGAISAVPLAAHALDAVVRQGIPRMTVEIDGQVVLPDGTRGLFENFVQPKLRVQCLATRRPVGAWNTNVAVAGFIAGMIDEITPVPLRLRPHPHLIATAGMLAALYGAFEKVKQKPATEHATRKFLEWGWATSERILGELSSDGYIDGERGCLPQSMVCSPAFAELLAMLQKREPAAVDLGRKTAPTVAELARQMAEPGPCRGPDSPGGPPDLRRPIDLDHAAAELIEKLGGPSPTGAGDGPTRQPWLSRHQQLAARRQMAQLEDAFGASIAATSTD